ncbi:hypothetical protein FACS1894172_16210 [Spirochaetia bacterium]|nr:hypothetical protein FACS1894164_20120 [Spirochaetia bacterium]GHU35044.1 hypothetical protein FACS1894172_16210 [Spirochaetia bacterium]
MELIQTNHFKKVYKKLHQNQLAECNAAIQGIIDNPEIGEQKAGDLDWLRVYKFYMQNQLTLLGYSVNKIEATNEITKITLICLGSHENFYRDLKKL